MLQKIRRLFTADSLTKKGTLNAIALLLDYGARMIVNLIITPIMLSGLGDTLYGIWVSANQYTVHYMSAAGGRPTQSLEFLTSNQQNTSDDETKRRAVGSALVVWISFVPLLLLVGGLLIWQFPTLTNIPAEWVSVTRWTIAILIVHLILFNLVDIPRAVLMGENMGYRRLGLSALGVLLMGGGMVAAVKLGWGLLGVAAMFSITILLTGLLFLQVTRQFVTWFGVARPKRDEITQLIKLSGWMMLWQLLWQFISAGDLLMLTFIGPDAVALYHPSRFAPQAITGIVSAAVLGLMPGLGGIIGAKNFKRAADIRAQMIMLTWFAVTVMGVVVLLCNRSFVTWWVGAEYYIGFWPFLLLVIMLMLMLFVRQDSNVIDYTLDVRTRMLTALFSVIVTIITSLYLFRAFDSYEMKLCGLLAGFIIGRLILLIAYPYLVSQALGIGYVQQYVGAIRPFIITVILFALTIWLSKTMLFLGGSENRWYQLMPLIGVAGVSTVITSIIAFMLGLTKGQRSALIGRIRTVL